MPQRITGNDLNRKLETVNRFLRSLNSSHILELGASYGRTHIYKKIDDPSISGVSDFQVGLTKHEAYNILNAVIGVLDLARKGQNII